MWISKRKKCKFKGLSDDLGAELEKMKKIRQEHPAGFILWYVMCTSASEIWPAVT